MLYNSHKYLHLCYPNVVKFKLKPLSEDTTDTIRVAFIYKVKHSNRKRKEKKNELLNLLLANSDASAAPWPSELLNSVDTNNPIDDITAVLRSTIGSDLKSKGALCSS